MNILDLPAYTIIERDTYKAVDLFQIERTLLPKACPRCGCVANLYRHEMKEQEYMDLPLRGRQVHLFVQRRRFKCRECNRTFFETLPEMDEKRFMTTRLIEYIQRVAMRRTFTSIADEVGVNEKTIRNIFADHITTLDTNLPPLAPKWLGIDEVYLLKKARCVFSNIQERNIIDMLPGRNKPEVQAYLRNMRYRERVELVTMDMWGPYRTAVRATLPDAKIVVDKFHIVRMANDAVEVVRKHIRAELPAGERRAMMRDRHVLLRRRHDVDSHRNRNRERDVLKLDIITNNYPLLGHAYELKEQLFDIWSGQDRVQAEKHYADWQASIPLTLRPAFKPLTTALKNWHQEAFAYFDLPVTNAYAESLNGLIKMANREGRGYSFEIIRAKLIYDGAQKTMTIPNLSSEPAHMSHDAQFHVVYLNSGNNISTLERRIRENEFWHYSTRQSE